MFIRSIGLKHIVTIVEVAYIVIFQIIIQIIVVECIIDKLLKQKVELFIYFVFLILFHKRNIKVF